jgi:hypothetical protein
MSGHVQKIIHKTLELLTFAVGHMKKNKQKQLQFVNRVVGARAEEQTTCLDS